MSDELDVLLDEGVIDEVLGRLKSGKEADVSLVRRGDIVIAAKVYKDVTTRAFKNNAEYKEGRKVRNSRTQRAMEGGGRFGRDAAEQAWKSTEADALYKLAAHGVRVPEPVMFYEGVLLMELVCDAEGRPAPRLIDVAIERDAAIGIYADLCAQMISMLCCDLIHGDLSPYNILAAADGPTIIDFPQVISAVHNSRAEFFFLRDFDNVVRFLAGFDPALQVHTADGRAIWRAYVSRELTPEFVPPPPPPPRRDEPRSRRPQGPPGRQGPPGQQGRQGPPGQQRSRGPWGSERPRGPQSPTQSQDTWSQEPQRPRGPQSSRGPQSTHAPQSSLDPQSPTQSQDTRSHDAQRPQEPQRPREPRSSTQSQDARWQGGRSAQPQQSRPSQPQQSRPSQSQQSRPSQSQQSRPSQSQPSRPFEPPSSRPFEAQSPRPSQSWQPRGGSGPRPAQPQGEKKPFQRRRPKRRW